MKAVIKIITNVKGNAAIPVIPNFRVTSDGTQRVTSDNTTRVTS